MSAPCGCDEKRLHPDRVAADPTCRQSAADILEADDEDWLRAGTCLWAALSVGPVMGKIEAHCGVPHSDLNLYSYRLRKAGIWVGTKTMNYPWLDAMLDGDYPLGAVGFTLQTGLATGDFVRDRTNDTYRMAFPGEGEGVPRWTTDQISGVPPRRHFVSQRLRRPRKVLV